jgi:hypothetical protein
LIEIVLSECGDTDRDLADTFLSAGRGDHDLLQRMTIGRIALVGLNCAGPSGVKQDSHDEAALEQW